MKILLSNDDGIFAKGIETLAMVLIERGHDVYVVAPDEDASGTGHGLTINKPLRYRKYNINGNFFGYMVNGKPADCVKLARWEIYRDVDFDFMISGINRGANLGVDLFYSGTFGAASEAALLGVRSIALSLSEPFDHGKNYLTAAVFAADFIEKIKDFQFPRYKLLNINVPNVKTEELKGYKFTIQGDRNYKENFDKRFDPHGNEYFWITGNPVEYSTNHDSDYYVLKENYVSVTPTRLDLTDGKFGIQIEKELEKWNG